MKREPKYRHEFKYIISQGEAAVLELRIAALMSVDPHVGEGGVYTIRSLYFDSFTDRCVYENESGTDPREKFRIRIYNVSAARIALECKRKERGKTLKTSCLISEEQCRLLMRGGIPRDIGARQTVLLRLALLMRSELFLPKVIVEYERTPYILRMGNVRVTFDRNIRSSSVIGSFLEEGLFVRPVMSVGQHVLEVKYDEFIPDYIKDSLEIGSLRQTAYSKYYLCRKFSTGGCYDI